MPKNLLPKTILVYVDKGVYRPLAKKCITDLQKIYPRFTVRAVDSNFVKKISWEKNCALLLIPGGRSLPYYSSLGEVGFTKIRKYVEKGGIYLGICAGAYFGSAFTEFEKGEKLEILRSGSLCFFNGKAVGPAYGTGQFRYNSQAGARIALIEWSDIKGIDRCYFNGGCFFENAEYFDNVTVMARYADIEDKPAAIISCRVGKGRVILSGIHLEGTLLGKFYFKLKPFDQKRKETLKNCLNIG